MEISKEQHIPLQWKQRNGIGSSCEGYTKLHLRQTSLAGKDSTEYKPHDKEIGCCAGNTIM